MKLLLVVALVAVGALVGASAGDIKRYLEMRRM